MDRTDRILQALLPVLTFTFLSGLFYIPLRAELGRMSENAVIKTYVDETNRTSDDTLTSNERRRAILYNRQIADRQAEETFFYRGTAVEDDAYRSLLSGSDGIMCLIEIPEIDVCLPVGHGTSDTVLETMAGHVCGTSLPVGGPSTNTVIAAHSGSTSSRLFTDLDSLSAGDVIYLHTLSEVLAYTIESEEDIRVVLPYDGIAEHAGSASYDVPYFQVRPGDDILTLYTCTPVGINSHRLIIQAKRTNHDSGKTYKEERYLTSRKARPRVIVLLYLLAPLLGSWAMYRYIRDIEGIRPSDSK